jgi:hypothetical protein
MQESNKSATAVPARGEAQENRITNDVSTTVSNAPAANGGKAVELVFVTNASAQPTAVAETPVKESPPAATPPPATAPPPPAAPPTADVPASQPLLAHARASDPSQEEKPSFGPALAAAPRGFFRENLNPLALMIVAGFGALYCFRMWLRTNARPKGNAFNPAHTEPDETVGQEP